MYWFICLSVIVQQEENIEEICLHVAGLARLSKPIQTSRTVIMTRGKEPVVVVSGEKIVHFPCHPISPDEIVDVNGAGDAFLGGFLAKFLVDACLSDCVAAGLSLSNSVIRKVGCSFV